MVENILNTNARKNHGMAAHDPKVRIKHITKYSTFD